jgi:hypothetical protein
MAHYLVRARPESNLEELRRRLDAGEIAQLRPFGGEMQGCLLNARIDAEGWATWEENCFCTPPLKQEREVLDRYFSQLSTTTIDKGTGWQVVDGLPSLWTLIEK